MQKVRLLLENLDQLSDLDTYFLNMVLDLIDIYSS